MQITLTQEDLEKMPPQLHNNLITWMNTKNHRQYDTTSALEEKNANPPLLKLLDGKREKSNTQTYRKTNRHIQMTELFDAGLIEEGMPVRVRLTSNMTTKTGRNFINGMEITSTGTISYNGKEFNKPSPLAYEINNTSLNGWEYIQIKKNNQWIFFNELREIYRKLTA